jgi:two-component system, cell cycle sensor histidine kinase and response regulator CckA
MNISTTNEVLHSAGLRIEDGTEQLHSALDVRFRTLFNYSYDAIFILQNDSIIDCNPRAEVLFGYKRDELRTKTPYAFSPTVQPDGRDSIEKAKEKIEKAMRGIPLSFEWTHRKRDGTTFVAEVTLNRITVDDDYLLLAIIHDITRRKDTEAELRYRIDFEKFIASISTNFINLTPDEIDTGIRHALEDIGTFAGVDRSFLYQLNEEAAEYRITHEWCSDGIASLLDRNLAFAAGSIPWFHEKIQRFENIRIADVSILPKTAVAERELFQSIDIQSILCVPLRVGKKLIGFIGFDSIIEKKHWSIETVTLLRIIGEIIANTLERKRRDEQIKASEQRYRTLFEASKDAVFTSTEDGRIIDMNPAGIEMLGYAGKEDLAKLDIGLDVYKNPQQREICKQKLREYGYVKDFEVLLKHRSGKSITCLVTATAYTDERSGEVYYQGFIRNVTDQKELERQLRQTQKMESLGQLAGGIAHDFNNVLGIVQASLSSLRSKTGKINPGLEKYVEMGENAVSRGAEVSRRLLTFSQSDDVKLRPMFITDVVKDLVNVLQHTLEKNITIEKLIGDNLSPFMGDHGQIYQMLLNLCLNARDAIAEKASNGAEGCIRISAVTVSRYDLPKGYEFHAEETYLRISVEDNGIGMPAHVREKIFDPFFTTKAKGKGTGLGLSVVYGIVQTHQGYIDIDSREGEGTIFNIYIPFAAVEHDIEPPVEITAITGGDETIFIVEDEEVLRSLMADILTAKGYRIVSASDGVEALKIFRERHKEFDAVILDMGLPKMPGQALFLKMIQLDPKANIILASGYVDEELKDNLLELGAKAFVQKPYKPQEILQSVRIVMDESKDAAIVNRNV